MLLTVLYHYNKSGRLLDGENHRIFGGEADKREEERRSDEEEEEEAEREEEEEEEEKDGTTEGERKGHRNRGE